MQRPSSSLGAVLAAGCTTLICLTGCGIGISASPATSSGTAMQGKVFGGSQPIVGATIQLYAVGNAGNGSAATPLIASTVTSGAGGSFSITGD